jgi:hypothetical protein
MIKKAIVNEIPTKMKSIKFDWGGKQIISVSIKNQIK